MYSAGIDSLIVYQHESCKLVWRLGNQPAPSTFGASSATNFCLHGAPHHMQTSSLSKHASCALPSEGPYCSCTHFPNNLRCLSDVFVGCLMEVVGGRKLWLLVVRSRVGRFTGFSVVIDRALSIPFQAPVWTGLSLDAKGLPKFTLLIYSTYTAQAMNFCTHHH